MVVFLSSLFYFDPWLKATTDESEEQKMHTHRRQQQKATQRESLNNHSSPNVCMIFKLWSGHLGLCIFSKDVPVFDINLCAYQRKLNCLV